MGFIVGVNGQLDPQDAKGDETNLVSPRRVLLPRGEDFRLRLITLFGFIKSAVRVTGTPDPLDCTLGPSVDAASGPRPISGLERGGSVARMLSERIGRFQTAMQKYRHLRYGATRYQPTADVDCVLDAARIDVMHFTTPQYFNTNKPHLEAPWDLQHLRWPEYFEKEEFARGTPAYKVGCERVHLVLVLTAADWTKRDIVEKLGTAPGKVVFVQTSSLIARRVLSNAEVEAAQSPRQYPNSSSERC
jgi:hypothetical protein